MAKIRTHAFFVLFMLFISLFITDITFASPKNVIFMIGDGMGPEQVRAGSFYASGEPNKLSFQSFPYTAECTTHSANNAVTDSAAAATALATSQKVNNGVISVALPGDGSELQTLLEYFSDSGKMTGLVTTVYITHATPAGFGAHETSRNNLEQIGDDYRLQTRPNVLLGGGANGVTVSEFQNAGYTVVTNRAQMQAIDPNAVTMLSGQFGSNYLPYEPDLGDLPHLSEMTATALDVLDNEPNGFFLMVEGGKIDEAGHANDLIHNIGETIEFSNAVQVVIDWAKDRDDTLILVTADHETGGLKVTQNNGQGVMPTVTWSTGNHTATNVPVYALGENAFLISGIMDNTEMFFICTCTPGEGAWNPSPVDGGINNDTKATLGWFGSEDAVSFDIYFGTDFNDVNDANNASVTFMLNQEGVSYVVGDIGSSYPDALVAGAAYYWRVDEINDVNGINDPNHIYKGDVWSFTVPPEKAWGPDPADGADGVEANIELSWYPAFGVTAPTSPHHVYFGESYDDVLNGTGDTDKGLFKEASYDPGMLEAGKTYYWRIDELIGYGRFEYWVEGDVWSFTVTDEVKYIYEIDVRVSAGADDAEEGPGSEGYYNTSSDLEMVDDPDWNGVGQLIGVHFKNINIPAGVTITNAYIEFTCDETIGGSESAYLLLQGNLSLTPESFGSGTSLISERPSTVSTVSWIPESWTSVGQKSRTSDISSIIQEIIDQDGWAAGNNIEIIISGDTSMPEFTGVRVAEAYDGSASQAPLLHLEYEVDEEPESP